MANVVHERLAHRLHSIFVPFLITDNETGSDNDGTAPPNHHEIRETSYQGHPCCQQIKWPHEMVTASTGQAPVYNDMSLAMFSNGYLTIMAVECSTVQDALEHN